MKLCAAQTRSVAGDVQRNIEQHERMIALAASDNSDIVVFPELSLTGYEPKLAKELATTAADSRLDRFQWLSDSHGLVIGIGLPIRGNSGVMIGTVFFRPSLPRISYCKQRLHSDELPYFVEGRQEVLLELKGCKIAPAICYESLLPEHAEKAAKAGAEIYCASVAKSVGGIEKALKHYPAIARKHSMTILMSNCLGPNDNFIGVGRTSVWEPSGSLTGQLDGQSECLLIYDIETGEAQAKGLAGPAQIIRKARPGDEPAIHEAHMRSIREVCIKDHGKDEVKGWGNRTLGDRWTVAVRDSDVWVIEGGGEIRGMA